MEAFFHFIFELVKISILASFYATLSLLAFKVVGNNKPESWSNRVSRKKGRFWFKSWCVISFMLFIFMFTHYGDHGLGDNARIPLGHHKDITETNGTGASIQDLDNGIYALPIKKFFITGDFVYGRTGDMNENYTGDFFLYDLKNNKLFTYENEGDYENALDALGLDSEVDLETFDKYYSRYWHGWRFWLLP